MRNPERSIKYYVLQYSITFGVCGIAVFIWLCVSGIFRPYEELYARTHWNFVDEYTKSLFLCTNAFFGVGVIVACVGLLVVASNGGAFEMLYYGIRRFFSLFQKDHRKFKFHTFYDYQIYRRGKPNSSFLFLLVIGILYAAVGLIFMSVYLGAMPAAK